MKKWCARLICLMLAALLVLSLLPVGGSAEELVGEESESTVKDFVVLLDCSKSLLYNDRDRLSIGAFKSFLNQLPAENARVAVIAFGYTGGDSFRFGGEIYNSVVGPVIKDSIQKGGDGQWVKEDAKRIHEIVPLQAAGTAAIREEIKTVLDYSVNTGTSQEGTMTGIGHAMTAAVELLERNGSGDGDACVILISDGVEDPDGIYVDPQLIEPAAKAAGKHDWPIYSVQLNYTTSEGVDDANKLLDKISTLGGGRHNLGRISCANAEMVYDAFAKIFAEFYYGDAAEIVEIVLPGEFHFEVPMLTSEASISVFGDSIESIDLVYVKPDGSEVPVKEGIREDMVDGNLLVFVEEGGYYTIRIILPEAGNWKLRLHGEDKAVVKVTNSNLREMNLKMEAIPSSSAAVLSKLDSIQVRANFTYQNVAVDNSTFYTENKPASLMVYGRGGYVGVFEMKASPSGYDCLLPLSEIPSGQFRMQVVLENPIFSDARKVSNVCAFKTENQAMMALDPEPMTLKGYVNGDLGRIDLSLLFFNPDGDPVTYTLTCTNDRSVEFAVDEKLLETGYMQVLSGTKPGIYQMRISAQDPDMAEPLYYDGITFDISNRDPLSMEIPVQELWFNSFGFQDPEKLTLKLNLNEYFVDPDGMALSYTVSAPESAALSVAEQDGKLEITSAAQEEGQILLTVTASDGISQITRDISVNLVSGKLVFWKQISVYVIVGAILLVIAIVVSVILLKNKRVKGNWEILADQNGNQARIENINIGDFLWVGKKGKFLLKDMVAELAPFMDGDTESIALAVPDFFAGNGAEKIELVGVLRSRGCNVRKIPKSDTVKVSCNGIEVTNGKASITTGSLNFHMEDPLTGNYLSITMRI